MMRKTLIFLLMASPALADVTSPSGKTVECYCTDKTGSRIELGQTICMQVDGRMFMAQCQMSLNSPMWRQVEEGCLSSSLLGGDQQPLQSFAVDSQI
ncbi:hypothetical protein [Tateyamaria sp. syn59]|uniref:hypothetical protein n=1 Tax=Tateyamaria sp. syn59 TaxID=2576942 RepID=UPI0011BE4A37|nr:hypothetical protein [Tateyamaria sp. syn59]